MSRMARGPALLDYLSGTCTGFAGPPLSMTIWAYPYDLVSSTIAAIGTSGSANNSFQMGLSSTNTAQAIEKDTVASAATTAVAATQRKWNNITAVFAAHNDRRVYLNGGNKVTNATARTAGATTGAFIMGDGVGGGAWTCDYAHFALWNIALSDADAANLYAVGPACTQAANLVEYWPLFGNLSPEPSTQTANSLTVTQARYSPNDPFGNFSRLSYTQKVFLAA